MTHHRDSLRLLNDSDWSMIEANENPSFWSLDGAQEISHVRNTIDKIFEMLWRFSILFASSIENQPQNVYQNA